MIQQHKVSYSYNLGLIKNTEELSNIFTEARAEKIICHHISLHPFSHFKDLFSVRMYKKDHLTKLQPDHYAPAQTVLYIHNESS